MRPGACTQGKDSIRYQQDHSVLPEAYTAIKRFAGGAPDALRPQGARRQRRATGVWGTRPYGPPSRLAAGKKPEDDLFDRIDPTRVNTHLKDLMPGLSIKVFRTFNASVTLNRLLKDTDDSLDVPGKKAQARCCLEGTANASPIVAFLEAQAH